MKRITDKQLREIFHFLFLEKLLRISDPKLFALKGGVNLRFFFNSPRYSEDMDLDVFGGAVETLKKNCFKILNDPSLLRVLQTFGIDSLKINDPAKSKQTETTQRFRVRLVNQAGEEFPTKIEFSRRSKNEVKKISQNTISPEISRQYSRLSFSCQHYTGLEASLQKVAALAGRPTTQARDVFDLYLLYLCGHASRESIQKAIESKTRNQALTALKNLDYASFEGQVVEYLDPESSTDFSSPAFWNKITKTIEGFLT